MCIVEIDPNSAALVFWNCTKFDILMTIKASDFEQRKTHSIEFQLSYLTCDYSFFFWGFTLFCLSFYAGFVSVIDSLSVFKIKFSIQMIIRFKWDKMQKIGFDIANKEPYLHTKNVPESESEYVIFCLLSILEWKNSRNLLIFKMN